MFMVRDTQSDKTWLFPTVFVVLVLLQNIRFVLILMFDDIRYYLFIY